MFMSLNQRRCLLIFACFGAAVAETIADASSVKRTVNKHIRARSLQDCPGNQFLMNNNKCRSCGWAGKNPDDRCDMRLKDKRRVSQECPGVCNNGPGPNPNPGLNPNPNPGPNPGNFVLDDGSTVSCTWASNKPDKRCVGRTTADGLPINQVCPNECGGGGPPPLRPNQPNEPPPGQPGQPGQCDTGGGRWGAEFNMVVIPIHSMLLPDGQILSYGTSDTGQQGGGMYYEVWNYKNGIQGNAHKLLRHNTDTDTFCSNLNVDVFTGNVVIIGGDVRNPQAGNGIEDVLEYNIRTEEMRHHPLGFMKYPRWYPTSIILPNGCILVVGGKNRNGQGSAIPEVFCGGGPNRGWRELPGARVPAIHNNLNRNEWWYPHTYVNSNHDVITFMPRGDNAPIYRVGVNGNGSIQQIGMKPFDASTRSPSVMFRTDQVAFLDGNGAIWVADISNSNNVNWSNVAQTGQGRTNGNFVLRPDGKVAILGGCRTDKQGGQVLGQAEKSVQIWDPECNQVTRGGNEQLHRLYHSTALIMPDSRIISMGGGAPGPTKNLNGQVYYSDYLTQNGNRPSVTCPKNINAGQNFVVSVNGNISRVTATRVGSNSHTRNCDTRWLELSFANAGNNQLQVGTDQAVMLPGVWLINVLDNNDVPSEACIVGVNMAALP